jgi:hypothetical protein
MGTSSNIKFLQITHEYDKGNKRGGRAWLVHLERCSIMVELFVFDLLSSFVYPDAIGCDALNTTVSDHATLIHPFLTLNNYNSSKYFWHRML